LAIDPVAALLEDLSSPDPTIRFSVLSRIEDLDWTPDTLTAFKRRLAAEADPGTRFQMRNSSSGSTGAAMPAGWPRRSATVSSRSSRHCLPIPPGMT